MTLLLDTCALLALADGTLPKEAAAAMKSAADVHVSATSAWEVALKVAAGKLQLEQPARQWFAGLCARYVLRETPLDAKTACAAAALPPLHRDPFDRVLVVLALAEAMVIVTSDDTIAGHPGIKTLW